MSTPAKAQSPKSPPKSPKSPPKSSESPPKSSKSPPKSPKCVEDTVEVEVEVEKPGRTKRVFTVVSVHENDLSGKPLEFDDTKRYFGTSPSGAARKAAYQIIDKVYGKDKDVATVLLSVREHPKGRLSKAELEEKLASTKKYSYTLTRTSAKDREPTTFGSSGDTKTTVAFPFTMAVKAFKSAT
jgi:hypothetical protein